VYHVMARGDGGKMVFETDDDRLVFLKRLEETCGSCGWRVHVSMGSVFAWQHLLDDQQLFPDFDGAETPPATLSATGRGLGRSFKITILFDRSQNSSFCRRAFDTLVRRRSATGVRRGGETGRG